MRVVEYTISDGACPIGSWEAIRLMGLPLIGAPHTKRLGRVRALLDLDDSIISLWDWIDRKWIPAKTASTMNRIKARSMNNATEEAD